MLLGTGNPINSKCPATYDFFLPFGGNTQIDLCQSDSVYTYVCMSASYRWRFDTITSHFMQFEKTALKKFSKPIELLFGGWFDYWIASVFL